jgi:hypothetical protein
VIGDEGKSRSTAYSWARRGLANGKTKPPCYGLRRCGMIICRSTWQSHSPREAGRDRAAR